ncbi:CHAT domain-containing protein [Pseudonocardia sp. TRM90224]|uniref:CHAT domain-containing protein n=1 Tax=Pseudonocardia sp. TRM90224 TaxID=2812678 RepID=UPI001E52C402|nr:CHAT domain-containing protein [Pseudonocardia sp. TRM90224]
MIRATAAYDGVVGNPKRSGPVAVAVLDEARRAGIAEAVVIALRAVAWFERSRLRHERSRRLLGEALRLAERNDLRQRLVEVLVTRAAVELELGRVDAASRDLARAGSIDEGAVPPDVEFMSAVMFHSVGRLGEAAAAYRRVLAHPDATADNKGSSANNAALIAALEGRFPESLALLDSAAEIADVVGASLHAFVAHNRGLVLAQSGRLAESVEQFDRATDLFTKEEIPLGEHFIEHADVLADLRLVPEALKLATRAVDELDGHGVRMMAAEARLTLAQVSLLAHDPRTAADVAAAALAQFRKQRRTVWAARANIVAAEAALAGGWASSEQLAALQRAIGVLERRRMRAAASSARVTAGLLALELGRRGSAEREFRRAAETSTRGPAVVRVRGRLAAAHVERLRGNDDAVLAHCRAGLADLARHRAALGSTELRALASGHGVELGRLGFETLLRRGSPTAVLDWMESTRAAALLVVEPPAPDAARVELAELAAVHAELAQELRESGGHRPELVARQAAAEDAVRRATWRRIGSGAAPVAAVRAAELRRQLDARVLVSYGTFDGSLFAVVLRATGRARLVRLGPVDEVRFEADALLFAMRRLTRAGSPHTAVAARASADHAVDRLAELLVRPLGLPPEAELVIVPSVMASKVPWSALHAGPVAVAPSASLWARTLGAATSAAASAGGVLVVAGPRLPGAVAEAAEVARLHPGCMVISPEAATVATVVEALGAAGFAHLACHGRLRGDNPTFSALELADGVLTVHELDLRGIAPRRVVLAACDSAADVAYDGDELLGFVSALLARGTAGLVASVVAVADVEAVDLMRALHHGLAAGLPMANALHTARATLDTSDPRAFVNWCAFTAYGAG